MTPRSCSSVCCRIRFIRQTRRWNPRLWSHVWIWSSVIITQRSDLSSPQLSGQVRFCRTCRSISCSRYSMARSTYSFLLEKVSGMLFPPGMMGTIFPSALCPTNESRGIICRTNTETSDQQVNVTVLLFHTIMERQPAQLSLEETRLWRSYRINKFAKSLILKHKPSAVHRDFVLSIRQNESLNRERYMKLFRLFLWIINQNIYSQNCFIVFAAPVRVFLWINNNANRSVTSAEPICSFILLIDEAATGFNVARLTSSQSSRKGEQEILSLRPLLPEQQMQPLPLLPRPGWRRRPCSVVAPTPPSPPLWAGSAANAPPGRICCINSGPGIPAERGFTERGLCEVVWTERGAPGRFRLLAPASLWGFFWVWWEGCVVCVSNEQSHRRADVLSALGKNRVYQHREESPPTAPCSQPHHCPRLRVTVKLCWP